MRIHSLSDNFNYIGFIVFSLRRCCLDIRAGSWISLISFCDVSIRESLCPLLFFSFFFFFCLFFSPCSQSQWFLCLLLACLVCVSASALPELTDYRAISVKARRLCQSSAPVFVSGLSCGVSSDTILATGLFFRWLLFCSMVQVVLSNYCFLSFFHFL